MSYILDALRRAEAERERERGTVPGVHARSLPTAAAPAGERRRPSVGLLLFGLAALLLALVLALLLAWVLWRGSARAPVSPAPVEMAAQPSPAPAPPALPQAPVVQIVPVPVPVPAPAVAAAPTPAPAAQAARRAQGPVDPAGAAAAPPPEQDSPLTRPLPLAQLPLDLRQSLPPLAVGGSVYSDNAAARFVMINGQVLREGESPAAGVSVERIDPKAVILRWRGLRIEVPL